MRVRRDAYEKRKNPRSQVNAVWGLIIKNKKSGDTYSRTFGTTIGSKSLTTVFGMGTGVAFLILSPEKGLRAG